MDREIKIGKTYKHFKGGLYMPLDVAINAETNEPMVVYKALHGECKTWVRNLWEFVSEVDFQKYPDARQRYRFEEVIM